MTSPMTTEERLKRIIYINNVHNQYYVGNPDEYQKDTCKHRQDAIDDAIKNQLDEVFEVISEAACDDNLPRRSVLFHFLGSLMNCEKLNPLLKSELRTHVLSLCSSDEDFFEFIKYYTGLRKNCKLPTSAQKLVQRFYHFKSAEELAESCSKFNSVHKWTHKDLIKLAHVRSGKKEIDAVFKYILKQEVSEEASDTEKKIIDIIKKGHDLRKTTDPAVAVALLSELKLTMKQVSPGLHQYAEVWLAAIPNMTIQEILPYLGKLYKLGLLKSDSAVSNILNELFTNAEKVKSSGVHPIEVLTYLKRLEKGGKPVDAKLLNHLRNEKQHSDKYLNKMKTRTEAKCPHIIEALQTCFDLACKNVSPTNKRYLVTIEVSARAKVSLCIGNKVLSFLEAAVAYAWVLLRTEEQVTVLTYKEDLVKLVTVNRDISYNEFLEKINAEDSTYAMLWSPIDWAIAQNKSIDVFTSFVHSDFAQAAPKEKKCSRNLESLEAYRKDVKVPDARLIIFCLNSRNFTAFYQDKDAKVNALEIYGFDTVACKVAECFGRGSFS